MPNLKPFKLQLLTQAFSLATVALRRDISGFMQNHLDSAKRGNVQISQNVIHRSTSTQPFRERPDKESLPV